MSKSYLSVPVDAALGVVKKKDKRSRNLELARKLYSTKGKAILEKVIEIALDDKNPNQMTALKLCLDRVAPVSFFDKIAHARTGGMGVQVIVNQVQPSSETIRIKTIEGEVLDDETI